MGSWPRYFKDVLGLRVAMILRRDVTGFAEITRIAEAPSTPSDDLTKQIIAM